MGLDMYLYKKNYVKNWDHMRPEEKHTIKVTKGGKTVKDIDPNKVTYIVEEIGYWRKANAIHNWFVQNVQKGVDDCKEYYVDQDELKKLLEAVNIVLAGSKLVKGKVHVGTSFTKEKGQVENYEDGKVVENTTLAEKYLPATDGFFFGSTKYDQYYIDDLKLTKEIIEKALTSKTADISYRSSW